MSVKPKWNLALDALIALAFLGTAVSGLVFFFDLAGRGSGGTSWLLTRDAWRSLHDWFGLAMVTGVGIHLLVHWKWILHATLVQLGLKGRNPRRTSGTSSPELAAALGATPTGWRGTTYPRLTTGSGARCFLRSASHLRTTGSARRSLKSKPCRPGRGGPSSTPPVASPQTRGSTGITPSAVDSTFLSAG